MAKKPDEEENRPALYVRLPEWVEERIRKEAALREITPQAVIRELLVERYRPEARREAHQ